MSVDIHSLILEELGKVPGPSKIAKNRMMVVCPFHDDKTPSCGVVMSEYGRYEIGSYNCLGCGAHGNWNSFAEKVGLRPIDGTMPKSGTAMTGGVRSRIKEMESEMLSSRDTDIDDMLEFLGSPATQNWPVYQEWRDYPGWLMRNLGCLMCVGGKKMHRNDVLCYMPVIVGRSMVGFIRAFMDKKPGRESYLSSEGDWTKTRGLFPYYFAAKMLSKLKKGNRYVVLVEGPRDALRLIMAGIPAMAILGSQNISIKKLKELNNLDLDYVFILPDNDKAGKALKEKIKWFCTLDRVKFDYSIKYLALPRDRDEDGKLIKIDPDNMPKSLMREMKELLREKYNCWQLKREIVQKIEINIRKI